MSARILASLLVRVCGAWLTIEGAALAFGMFYRSGEDFGGRPAIADLIAGIVLLLTAGRVGAWLVRDLGTAESTADAGRTQSIFFSIAGYYFLVAGLAQVAAIAYTMLTKPTWDQTGTLSYLWENAEASIGTAISYTLGGGILLLSRVGTSNAVARAWRVIRSRQD